MPKLPATTPLRCPNCGKHEDPAHPRTGPRADGGANRRRGQPAYHVRCQSCGHEWESVTKRAKVLSREADAKATRRHRKVRRAAVAQ